MKPVGAAMSAAALLLPMACQSRRLYYWHHYEPLTYHVYSAPQKATLERQRDELEEDIQKAAGRNLRVNPGLHAHLGYVYFQLGQYDLAEREFEAEKVLFPESIVFMDRMLRRSQGTSP